MENLLLVRIDDRLIHGQVMTAWMKTLPAQEIIVVDDRVAKDEFMLFVLQNAAPKGVKVVALSEEDAVKRLQEGLKVPSYILAKSPVSLKRLVEAGIDIKAVNIGGMGMRQGRTVIYKNVSADEEERACIREFLEKGIDVAIQIIPSEKRFELKNI
ncbi:PTS mannose/fructose/sorbose transporter subunit IIB [Lachnoclostridium sp. An131]|uniref:PTS sugar transporter subunit IIB n=1 Tax=Lachnoclostridium sp. An131 TaxID=1965555 RepID=UPI000B3799F0|nr:PTS sugar transporter subunit IIB [Lachnoclostridium sp. An131]OUQ28931.1 PTS mannose/fructose/sorbose transporter subunit IIB [Lachnoclostridium sp. An131]